MKRSILKEANSILLKKLRKNRGLSQENLAEIAGLDRTYISGVERKNRNITLDSLERILNALDIPVERYLALLVDEVKELGDKTKRSL
jgi:transcriptional regulator with XRE-family HTH domain